MLAPILLELGIPTAAATALVVGVASYLYLPVIGKKVAAGLVIVAASVAIYGAGFNERGALDRSADLAAQVVQMKADAASAKAIATEANARQVAAEDETSTIQEKVDAYAAELAKRKTPGCAFNAHDVGRMRSIAGSRAAAKPAAGSR